MRVLVTFGSKRQGTAELARSVGHALETAGHEPEVRPAAEVEDLDAYDAVIVGGALYAGRWHRQARAFVRRHADELRGMPVYFFSSGPLDDSANQSVIEPTSQVRRLMDTVGGRGHTTFGGRLAPDAKGMIASAIAKQGRAGDWRDLDRVRAWAHAVGAELDRLDRMEQRAPRPAAGAYLAPAPVRKRLHRLIGVLLLFTGTTALVGGIALIVWRHGAPWLPTSLLAHTPFSSFLVPGLLLVSGVAITNLVSAALELRRHRWGEVASIGAGVAITTWIATEMVLLRTVEWLQVVYLGVGAATLTLALWLWSQRRATLGRRKVPAPLA